MLDAVPEKAEAAMPVAVIAIEAIAIKTRRKHMHDIYDPPPAAH